MGKIFISKIPNLNTIVIRQIDGRVFITTPDSIMVSPVSLAAILKQLVKQGFLSKKVLQGILSELEE